MQDTNPYTLEVDPYYAYLGANTGHSILITDENKLAYVVRRLFLDINGQVENFTPYNPPYNDHWLILNSSACREDINSCIIPSLHLLQDVFAKIDNPEHDLTLERAAQLFKGYIHVDGSFSIPLSLYRPLRVVTAYGPKARFKKEEITLLQQIEANTLKAMQYKINRTLISPPEEDKKDRNDGGKKEKIKKKNKINRHHPYGGGNKKEKDKEEEIEYKLVIWISCGGEYANTYLLPTAKISPRLKWAIEHNGEFDDPEDPKWSFCRHTCEEQGTCSDHQFLRDCCYGEEDNFELPCAAKVDIVYIIDDATKHKEEKEKIKEYKLIGCDEGCWHSLVPTDLMSPRLKRAVEIGEFDDPEDSLGWDCCEQEGTCADHKLLWSCHITKNKFELPCAAKVEIVHITHER